MTSLFETRGDDYMYLAGENDHLIEYGESILHSRTMKYAPFSVGFIYYKISNSPYFTKCLKQVQNNYYQISITLKYAGIHTGMTVEHRYKEGKECMRDMFKLETIIDRNLIKKIIDSGFGPTKEPSLKHFGILKEKELCNYQT